jgi:hypothetical protein
MKMPKRIHELSDAEFRELFWLGEFTEEEDEDFDDEPLRIAGADLNENLEMEYDE